MVEPGIPYHIISLSLERSNVINSQYREAIDTFSSAVVVDPSSVNAVYGRGAVYGYVAFSLRCHHYQFL
jgi:hypothetical protein